MVAAKRRRWTTALLTVAVLVPALHGPSSHSAQGSHAEQAFAATSDETGSQSREACPTCLATQSGTALAANAATAGVARSVAPCPRLHDTRLAISRVATGPASPRSPPYA